MSEVLTVYSDGSALKNPGPGGWAWWYNQNNWVARGYRGPVTNNAMELEAIAQVLANTPSDKRLVIRTDSRYSIDAVTKWAHGWARNGWRKKDGGEISNLEIIRVIHEEVKVRPVKFEWVKAHNGEMGNERVDELARNAAEQAKAGRGDHQIGPGWTGKAGDQVG